MRGILLFSMVKDMRHGSRLNGFTTNPETGGGCASPSDPPGEPGTLHPVPPSFCLRDLLRGSIKADITNFFLQRAQDAIAWAEGEKDLQLNVLMIEGQKRRVEKILVRVSSGPVSNSIIDELIAGNPLQEIADAIDLWLEFFKRDLYPRTPIPKNIRLAVLERDRYTCRYCGSMENLTLDHIFPYSRGGEHTEENLVTACKSCNSRKHDKTPEEAKMPLRFPLSV